MRHNGPYLVRSYSLSSMELSPKTPVARWASQDAGTSSRFGRVLKMAGTHSVGDVCQHDTTHLEFLAHGIRRVQVQQDGLFFCEAESGRVLIVTIKMLCGRIFSAIVTGVVLVGLIGCTSLFPSRPLSDKIFVRNSVATIELAICSSGQLEPLVVGRGPLQSNSELLPLAEGPIFVTYGAPTTLGTLSTVPDDSLLLTPLGVGERLGLTLELYDGERRFRIEGDFSITEEVAEGFSRGDWLSASGELVTEPCAE